MRDFPSPAPPWWSVSTVHASALDAALWAVDEAVSRDIPLRLVYAIDPDVPQAQIPRTQLVIWRPQKWRSGTRSRRSSRPTSPSRSKSRSCKPDRRVRCLRPPDRPRCSASARWALATARTARIGSTAAAVAASAHCPVAIVRGGRPASGTASWVVAEVDESPAEQRCPAARALMRRGFARRRFAC